MTDGVRRPVRDLVWRLAYRLAYFLLTIWWHVRRPSHLGALVSIEVDGKYLLVRASYRRGWQFPGGGVDAGETPVDAAVREVAEELDLMLDRRDLIEMQDTTHLFDGRSDRALVFAARLTHPPKIRIDYRELVDSRFFSAQDALRLPLTPHVAEYLATRVASGQTTGS